MYYQKHSYYYMSYWLEEYKEKTKKILIGLAMILLLYEVSSNATKFTFRSGMISTGIGIIENTVDGFITNETSDNYEIAVYPIPQYGVETDDAVITNNDIDHYTSSTMENEIIEETKPTYNVADFNFCDAGYIKATNLNVRSEPSTDSDVISRLDWNDEIQYSVFNEDWAAINLNGEVAFISQKYISSEKLEFQYLDVSGDKRKSYMDYQKITSKTSPQYKLQTNYANTDSVSGLRMVGDRYCIALGSYYSKNVGQLVDIVLENGTVIPCVVGDCKSNRDTNENNSVGNDGSVAEFIVETASLSSEAKYAGDVSKSLNGWDSKVVGIRLYDKNVLHS